ncbi:MAG TPA: hypothetical protein VNA30_03625 [Mycobacteriales bacterium]|nr:hypothetical protein [Mycobacteriales bacterium]
MRLLRRAAAAGVLVAGAAALALAAPSGAAPLPAASGLTDGVLVIGVPGLRWSDIDADTPAIARLAASSAVGALSVKATSAVTCPADGWLVLGAGNRLEAPDADRKPCAGEATVDDGALQRRVDSQREGADPGALVAALSPENCVDLDGPGTALVAATEAPPPVRAGGCRLRIVGLPAVGGGNRTGAARNADAEVARLLTDLPQGWAVLLVGLSAAAGEDASHLHVAIRRGNGQGQLTSASTRRAPYVQLVDVAPTVLDLLHVPQPASMIGQPWRMRGGEVPAPADLTDLDRKAGAHRDTTVPFYVASLALVLVGLWFAPRLAGTAGAALLGASYLANLLPWWRADIPLLALLGVTAVGTAVLTALALRTPHPAGSACALTAAVIAVDVLTGAHLQMSSVAGYSPLVAGRFAGLGNVAFGVFAAAVLLATAAYARRALVVAVVGFGAVLMVGAPWWGSDVGGVLALVPAFTVLALQLGGRRVSPLPVVAAGAAGAAAVAALAVLDASRPADARTHLGRFAHQVYDGAAGSVLRRKATAVLDLLFHSPVTALLPLVVAAAVFLVLRPPPTLRTAFERDPGWRHGLLALGVASLIGFAVNDSGAAIPALALVVAVPATVAVMAAARPAAEGSPDR